MKQIIIAIVFIFLFQPMLAQSVELIEQGKATSIRGLSIVNDNVAWVSGSKGHIAVSVNGGKTWNWQQVKGFEQSDFRDIEAFSDKEAIVMSSGTPALILKTTDGGVNWKVVFRNSDKAYFLDAMAFASRKHGYTMGDPIDGKFLLLETKDGGETWNKYAVQPPALPGEAAFAASGTCLSTTDRGNAIIMVTGGSIARKITLSRGRVTTDMLPITQGKASQGVFSYAKGNGREVFTGGDYEKSTKTDSVACYSSLNDKKVNVSLATHQPAGYQSCVINLQGDDFLSTGTPGTNLTDDGGNTWKRIDVTSYNVCQKAKKGNLVLLAGDKGKIGLLKL
jgi:photosystem II stability/assembly factor-like uncharacterized protein